MNKNLRFLMLTLLCAVFSTAWGDTATFNFGEYADFANWGTSYKEHTLQYDVATVTFTEANHNTQTITDCPVTKGKPVSLVMNEGYILSKVTFVCKQWSTKTQTITLHYSTDSGENYTSTGVESTDFTISDNLPQGTNAVKITFSSTNQIGIVSAKIEYSNPSSETLAAPTFSPMPSEGTTYTSAQTISITNNEPDSKVYYTLDETTPSSNSTEYTTPIKLSETKTLKAIAIKGSEKSAVTTAKYTIKIPDVATLNNITPTSVNVNTNNTFTLDALFNSDNYSLTWESNNGNLLTVDNQGNYTVKGEEGTVTITVTAQSENEDNYKSVSKDFDVTIVDPDKPGTQANPYTVAQALEFIETLGNSTSGEVYVSGIISKIQEINLDYKNATYWISDDGTESSQLEVFRGKYLDGADFTSEDQIAVGDEVTIFGKLKKYQGTTPEFDQGNKIVAHSGKITIATDVTVTPTTIDINTEGNFTASVAPADGITSDDYNVIWACDAEDFIVNESTGEYIAGATTGSINISVTVVPTQTKSNNYKSFRKVIEIDIVNPDANDGSLDKAYTVAEVISGFDKIKGSNGWVKGYLVGVANNGTINQIQTEGDISTISNVILSDSPSESSKDKVLVIGLPNNSVFRSALNYKDNKEIMKNVLVYVNGTFGDYCHGKGFNPTEDACISTIITSAGYSTLYFGNTSLEVPNGTTAYAITVNGNDLTYTSVDGIIPAGTGVVLQGSGEQKLHLTKSTGTAPGNNDLLGFDVASVTVKPEGATGDYLFYMLSGGVNGVGFYYATNDSEGNTVEEPYGQPFISGAHKAYLAVEDTGGTTVSSYVFDDFTDIKTIDTEVRNPEGVYTITGVRMNSEHLPAGLYIVNGKKVIIK